MRIIIIFLICTILSIQDIKYGMIYSPLNCVILLVGFATNNISIINKISGLIIIPVILLIINHLHKRIIGEGDIEFISASGLYLGFAKQNILLFISCIMALIYMTITKKESIPMIPFLSIGLIICLLL